MKISFFGFLYLFLFRIADATGQSDALVLKRIKNDYVYTFQGQPLSEQQLYNQLKTNKQAWKTLRNRQSEDTFGEILGYSGLALLGYSLAMLIIKDELNPLPFCSGIVCFGLSIPFVRNKQTRTRSAVRIYNTSLSP